MEVVSQTTTFAPAQQNGQFIQGGQQYSSPSLQSPIVYTTGSPSLRSTPGVVYTSSPALVQQPSFIGQPSLGQLGQQSSFIGSPSLVQQPSFIGSPSLVQQPSSFGRFIRNDSKLMAAKQLQQQGGAGPQLTPAKLQKRRAKQDRKIVKEERASMKRGQRLEERLRLEDYKMRNCTPEQLEFWLMRYQTRSVGLQREAQLLDAHLERMRGVLAERTNNGYGLQQQQQLLQNGPQQTFSQTVTTTTYPASSSLPTL